MFLLLITVSDAINTNRTRQTAIVRADQRHFIQRVRVLDVCVLVREAVPSRRCARACT